MPITKTPAFMTSDGNTYQTLEIAQRAELLKLPTSPDNRDGSVSDELANPVLHVLFANLDAVKEILRATGRRARGKAKGNGAARKRKTAVKEASV